MKFILACFVLLFYSFTFSQFSRTYFHASPTRNTFSSYAFVDSQNQQHLVCLSTGSSTQIQLAVQKINNLGEVIEVVHQNYSVGETIGTMRQYILGVAETLNERYYMLKVGDNSGPMKLVWLKVNKNNGALISSFVSSDTYLSGFSDAKLIGNELVCYDVKSSTGLVRVALNISSFSTPSEELVDASILVGNSNVFYGYKSGSLFVVNALEKLVFSSGTPNSKLFTRNGSTSYVNSVTGITTNRSVSSFLINPTTIGITNGTAIEHYNASGTLTTSGTFSVNSIWPINKVTFINNEYHIFTKSPGTEIPTSFYKANTTFVVTDSLTGRVSTIYQFFTSNGANYILGNGLMKGIPEDLSGEENAGVSVFFERYTNKPTLNFLEYGNILKVDSRFVGVIGMGTSVISIDKGLRSGLTFDNHEAIYYLAERFIGFTATGDTLTNVDLEDNRQIQELPGPYTLNSLYDEVQEAKYNRPYHVSRQMIEDHLYYVSYGSVSYTPVWDIANWPAHGNTALGQASNLAPFVDVNGNGIYEPLQGDYPQIYGDDCMFSITHYRDNGNANKALEFHSYVYTQKCDTSEVFDHVLMRKVKVISRGAEIDSLYYGGVFEGDLGHRNDDYMGTHVELGMLYNYNGDLMDENNSGSSGFQDTLPAHGILVLKGFKQENDGVDNGIGIFSGESVNGYGFNDGIIDNEYTGLYASVELKKMSDLPNGLYPTNTMRWYNLLNGVMRYGTKQYFGGTGYGGGCVTNIETRYMFPAHSDPLHWSTSGIDPGFTWSELEPCGTSSTPNMAFDRTGLFSFGKTALSNGDFVELDYAYLIKRQSAPTTTLFEPVLELFTKAGAIRSAFLNNEGPCGINFDPIQEDLSIEENTTDNWFTIYPNPTTGTVRIAGLPVSGAKIEVFDVNGRLLSTIDHFNPMETLVLSGFNGQLFIVKIATDKKVEQKRVLMSSSRE